MIYYSEPLFSGGVVISPAVALYRPEFCGDSDKGCYLLMLIYSSFISQYSVIITVVNSEKIILFLKALSRRNSSVNNAL
ncbi:hypothetical protein EB241_12445 [Erwinia psidii]|uniref:Uncharacterized protein n=1 Tax=Erwinia psidii TaxID=69224 RepID=A0A3N6S000_9GAMM|nr:hypothetical protein EB241_12445 [Erwinia psidii]